LVTGGAGYIGAHIVDLLCDSNYSVIVLDNLSSGYKENLNPKAKLVIGDILNKDDLNNLFKSHKFLSVIHMAGLKAAGESMLSPDIYTENNIFGSLNLISVAIKYNVEKIIFSSTAAVYGEPLYNPIDENHPLSPVNHYGFTKLSVENYLSWISKINKIKYVALRYFNAAGYTEKDNLIKYKEHNSQNLLPIVMEVANGSRSMLEVYGNDYNTSDGTCIRDYINVVDLASAHIKSLKYLENSPSCSINLSTGKGYSVLDIINITEKITRNKINYNFSDRREGDAAVLISSYNKAKKELGWAPEHSSIEKIVKSMWKHYK